MNFPRSKPTLLAALIAASFTLQSAPAGAQSSAQTAASVQSAPTLSSGIDPTAIDGSVRAQDDLFHHVNGTWLKTTPFPADKAYVGSAQKMYDLTQDQLRALVEAAPRGSQVGDFYASFMDEAGVDKLGAKPLAAEMAAIDAVTDRKQLGALFAHLSRIGASMPVVLYIGQDARDSTRYVPLIEQSGLSLPTREYYLKLDDEKFKNTRAKYVDYIAKLMAMADGKPAAELMPTAQAILALETEIARVQWSPVERRDPVKSYNPVAATGLPEMAPLVDWTGYLASAGIAGKAPTIIVRQPSYLKGLNPLLDSVPLATWKAYARAHLLHAYAPYLAKSFVDARFDFVGPVLTGATEQRPRWKRGVQLVDQSLGEALGKQYVAQYFPPESKRRMDELVANLLSAYRESIVTLDWMSPQTKKEALAKLAKFNTKVGYPKRWIDYAKLDIKRDDLVGNVIRAHVFDEERDIAKLGQPIDRDEWGMTPQTINAYYNPSMNEIVFPAAFLQAPNFSATADDAVNYGAIGAVIGHEISHGFDDKGSQYDGDGNLRDWWSPQDKERFAAKTRALVAQYSAFVPVKGYTVNGELTLGENIADNSGLAIAYKAYRISLGGKPAPVIDGMSGDERFFYGYAQAWRGKVRDEALLAQIKSDPHSPDEFRVTGAVRNQEAFYSAFGIKPGDKMYLPPSERVSIW